MRTATAVFLLITACASTARRGAEEPAATAPSVAPSPPELARVARLEKAGAVLDAALAAPDPEVRGEALAALGASGRGDALARLSDALGAEHGKLRFGGARGLSYLRDRRAAQAIAVAFRKEQGWAVRAELARAAGACGARELVPDLEKALWDPRREVAVAAACALEDLGDRAGSTALVRFGSPERKGVPKEGVDRWSRKVLGGKREGDRALAARTLAEVGTSEDVELLEPFLAATETDLRIWAAAAIVKLGPPRR
jgi:HEAT repeat protein